MRIAQVAPLQEAVPPKFYGGTERVVSYLTEALTDLGHKVTLFASGDSTTKARLVAVIPKALRLCPNTVDPIAPHVVQLQQVLHHAAEFDVIHFHTDYLHYPLARHLPAVHLTTLHGRLDIPELQDLYYTFSNIPVVSISHQQRHPVSFANWQGTVHHGLPTNLLRPLDLQQHTYAAFLGRISPEKRVDIAIEIAQRVGVPLKIAAKIDNANYDYYKSEIRHLLKLPGIDYIGEINENQKAEFLGKALCLLFPIDWPEPFGMVMIEAMACGTPILAFRRGGIPEVIDEGVTGFIVDGIAEAIAMFPRLVELDRCGIRRCFEQRFSAQRMAEDYLILYQRLLSEKHNTNSSRASPNPGASQRKNCYVTAAGH